MTRPPWLNPDLSNHWKEFFSSMTPLCGLRPFIYQEGKPRGMRGVDGWTGSGLRFTLWPDRALDVGPVWFQETPIAWSFPAVGGPAQYEPQGAGWLRIFSDELLTTCGLTHYGTPDELNGQHFGLHGRIAHIPAENLRLWQEWRDDDYYLIVEGEMRHAVLFGENLHMHRSVETHLGG